MIHARIALHESELRIETGRELMRPASVADGGYSLSRYDGQLPFTRPVALPAKLASPTGSPYAPKTLATDIKTPATPIAVAQLIPPPETASSSASFSSRVSLIMFIPCV
jgi:hypothetical protein